MDTGPDPDRQALEADSRSAKMMSIRPDPQTTTLVPVVPSLPYLFAITDGGQNLDKKNS